jgi:hypothetical protein
MIQKKSKRTKITLKLLTYFLDQCYQYFLLEEKKKLKMNLEKYFFKKFGEKMK